MERLHIVTAGCLSRPCWRRFWLAPPRRLPHGLRRFLPLSAARRAKLRRENALQRRRCAALRKRNRARRPCATGRPRLSPLIELLRAEAARSEPKTLALFRATQGSEAAKLEVTSRLVARSSPQHLITHVRARLGATACASADRLSAAAVLAYTVLRARTTSVRMCTYRRRPSYVFYYCHPNANDNSFPPSSLLRTVTARVFLGRAPPATFCCRCKDSTARVTTWRRTTLPARAGRTRSPTLRLRRAAPETSSCRGYVAKKALRLRSVLLTCAS